MEQEGPGPLARAVEPEDAPDPAGQRPAARPALVRRAIGRPDHRRCRRALPGPARRAALRASLKRGLGRSPQRKKSSFPYPKGTRGRRDEGTHGRRRPNLLFIWTDEQRPDTLGAYGNRHIRTPHLDRLAAQGVVFEQAYCTQPVCSPSRASVAHRALPPHATACCRTTCPCRPACRPWPSCCARPGYACGYVGKWHLGPELARARAAPGLRGLLGQHRGHVHPRLRRRGLQRLPPLPARPGVTTPPDRVRDGQRLQPGDGGPAAGGGGQAGLPGGRPAPLPGDPPRPPFFLARELPGAALPVLRPAGRRLRSGDDGPPGDVVARAGRGDAPPLPPAAPEVPPPEPARPQQRPAGLAGAAGPLLGPVHAWSTGTPDGSCAAWRSWAWPRTPSSSTPATTAT